MGTNCILLVAFFLALPIIDCSAVELEVKANANTGLDIKTHLTSNEENQSIEKRRLDSAGDNLKVDQVKQPQNQAGSNEDKSNLDRKKSIQQKESEDHEMKTFKDGSSNGVKVKEGDKKEKVSDSSTLTGKESNRAEECDASSKCTNKDKLVACLRVPGNDSPGLSLLIQNKGSSPLAITISASDFVKPEKTAIQLPEKENEKVRVSIEPRGTENLIIVRAGDSNCTIEFQPLGKESDDTHKTTSPPDSIKTRWIAFVYLAAVLLIAALAWTLYKRKHFHAKDSSYQKLDTQLPISEEVKTKSQVNDGWDDSWNDNNWEDVEAPKTPSKPLTPSFTSQGLASRRFPKDGWKD